jgi:hypothetical protein
MTLWMNYRIVRVAWLELLYHVIIIYFEETP